MTPRERERDSRGTPCALRRTSGIIGRSDRRIRGEGWVVVSCSVVLVPQGSCCVVFLVPQGSCSPWGFGPPGKLLRGSSVVRGGNSGCSCTTLAGLLHRSCSRCSSTILVDFGVKSRRRSTGADRVVAFWGGLLPGSAVFRLLGRRRAVGPRWRARRRRRPRSFRIPADNRIFSSCSDQRRS